MSLGTPQGTSGGGGLFNLLGGILGGIHQQNVNQESLKESKQDEALKMQEGAQQQQMNALSMKQTEQQLQQNQMTMQSAGRAQAGKDLQALTQQMITDPARAKDPAFIAKYNELSAASGQLPEMTKDGAVDVDRLKPAFNTSPFATDPSALTKFVELPTATQKSILDQYSGVPKGMYNQKAFVDAKTQAAISKAQSLDNHYLREDTYKAHLDDMKAKYYDEKGQLIPSMIAEYNAKIGLDGARASALVTTAGAAAMRASAYSRNVDNAMTRFRANPSGGSQTLVRSILSQSGSQLGQLRTEYEKALALQAQNRLNSVDDTVQAQSDAAVESLNQALNGPDGAIAKHDALLQEIGTNPQVSSFLSAGSGKSVENVQPKAIGKAPPGASDGYYPNAKGGAVTVRGGQLYRGKV